MKDRETEQEELMELMSQESNPNIEIARLRRENRDLRENLRYNKRKKEEYELYLNILLDNRPNRRVIISQEIIEQYKKRQREISVVYKGEDRTYMIY